MSIGKWLLSFLRPRIRSSRMVTRCRTPKSYRVRRAHAVMAVAQERGCGHIRAIVR